MRYEAIPRMGREQIENDLANGSDETISQAILSASLYDPDGQWAQEICLRFLAHPDKNVRWNAATGLSHIARIHGQLNTEIVIPRLKACLSDSEIAANVEDTLNEIAWWLRTKREV